MQNDEQTLSRAAQARKHAMLPGLLQTVRARRRRRRATFAAGWLLAALAVGFGWHGLVQRDEPSSPQAPGQPWRPEPVCEIVRDDPGVVARYRVAASDDVARWFVDDDGLQEFLRASERPSGIVRVGGRASVATSALDPFPTAME